MSARNTLGWMYTSGRGVPQNEAEAAAWYRKAAEQGHASVQHSLGWMYAEGRGVPQNYVDAYLWMNLAAARAEGATRKEFAEVRDKAGDLLTPQQQADAQQRATEWMVRFDQRAPR